MEINRLSNPTEKEVRKMLEEKEYLKKVIFTGGEPLLNKNILRYIKMAKDIGYESIALVTNGRLFANRKLCIDAILSGLNQITISFHGHNQEIHESLTRSIGSFKQSLEGIKNVSDFKKNYKVSFNINVTLTKLNFEYANEIYDILSHYDIDLINFNLVEPRGFAKQFFDMVVPKYSDVCKQFFEYGWLKRKIHVSLSGTPPCITHKLKIELGVTEKWHIKIGNKYKIYKPKHRKKLPSCEKCKYFDGCDGIWIEYLKHYGGDEFEPVLNTKKWIIADKVNNLKNRPILKRNAGYIQITRKCNRKCVFCSNPYVEDTLSFKDAVKEIDDYIKKGVNEIILSGGEPTLNTNLFELIRYCKGNGTDCRIITNGEKLADESYAKKIAEAGLRNVNISIYSHKKDIQDKLTQKQGSYEKTLLAMKNTLKHISVPNINITINKLNADHLDDTVKFIVKKFPRIKHFVFNNLDPTGRAIKNKWTIPRLVDLELSLNRTLFYLSMRGKSFRVERVPLCYMQGFEEFSTETRKIVKNETYRCLFLDKNGRELREIRKFYYKKAACCEVFCSLNEICAGLNPRYVKFFGSDELFPVFGNKHKIIRKVKNGQ